MRVDLTGVPETMLWTLHNRASESLRNDRCLHDPEAERIYSSIEYDFEKSFGRADASHAVRSLMFDGYLREFLDRYPNGVIVNLGEGLETQRFRVDGEDALWLSVDVPEGMAARERFIEPDDRHKHIACSALDDAWYAAVPSDRPVYITAQGLLMYFEEREVREHLISIAKRFPGAWYAFDVVPRWLSRKASNEKGWHKTLHYKVPRAPWGINRNDIVETMKTWVPSIDEVIVEKTQRYPRGFFLRHVFYAFSTIPVLRRITPSTVRLRFGEYR